MTTQQINDVVEDRWHTLTVGIDGYDATETNSRLVADIMERQRELAARMIHGADSDDEYSALSTLENQPLVDQQNAIQDFAVGVLAAHAAK